MAEARDLMMGRAVDPEAHRPRLSRVGTPVIVATQMLESMMARTEGFAGPGKRLVITAGVPFGTPGVTNVLRVGE